MSRKPDGAPAFGFVTILSDDDEATARIDFENCSPSGGTSTIEDVDRPRRVSLTKFDGQSPRRMTLALVLDTHAVGVTVRPVLDSLRRMSRPPGKFRPPPKLRWTTGGVLPFDYASDKNAEWWIEDVQWDMTDSLVMFASSEHGREPSRQFVSVLLVEVVEPEYIGSVAKRNNPTSSPSVSAQIYIAKRGDTLQRIAQIKLHDSKRWPEIKALNPSIHDPKKIAPQTAIVLPPVNA